MKNLTKQRGTAIIVALFVTALVAAAAIAMIEYLRIDTRRTQLVLNDIEANQLAQGSLDWAIDQLIQNAKLQQPTKLIDKLPLRSSINTVNGMKIYSTIYDAQSRLNVNDLANNATQLMLQRLIQLSMPKMQPEAIAKVMQAITDWITPGIVNSPFDSYYAKLNPPYHAPHRPMVSISELRLVQGVTPELYAKLAPSVTALPDKANININTAGMPILRSLAPNITEEAAKAIIVYRNVQPVTSLSNLANFDVVKNSAIDQNSLTASSTFFMVITHVLVGDQDIQLNTLLKRITQNSQPSVIIVWQSKGTV